MSRSRSEQIEQVFHDALQVEPGQRDAFLTTACGGDASLLAEVRALLNAHDSADGFLAAPLSAGFGLSLARGEDSGLIRGREDGLVGQRVGAWRLTKRLAAGGMGTVYLASRDDGQYQKQAAIKLIRPGIRFDDPQHRRRIVRQFRDEQQLLADLDHPHIAKLFDGGTSEDGLPYLVMEYIEGRPITEYCEKNPLSTSDRLKLFCKVCHAVQYAHGKLIAHRDLKPRNILVVSSPDPGADPIPKLLDFGIAKILKEGGIEDAHGITSLGFRPMTLDYASPEQVRGEAVTTVSDVYSLGVVLYEVLTGQLPYQVSTYSAEATIGEQKPRRPSAVRRTISREVDAIVLKALQKDPANRYQSAAGMADDIERYLSGKPVLAHPPSVLYQLGKFVVRNKWAIVSTVVVLVWGVATGLLIGMALNEAAEKESIEKQRNLASRLFYVGRSAYLREQDYVTAEAIFRQVLEIDESLPRERDTWLLAERRGFLGRALMAQGRYRQAEPYLTDSYLEFRRSFGEDDDRTVEARQRLEELYRFRDNPVQTSQPVQSAPS